MTQAPDDGSPPRKSARARRAQTVERSEARAVKTEEASLIVGIGASAGGLDAFKAFLAAMPPDSGMAFILVQHLAPQHKSILTDLLARATLMPVLEAQNGMRVVANQVFVIPPNSTLTIRQRVIQLSRPAPPREWRRPIDTFFFSLAEDQGENAICIVLSGTGTDGSLGLKTIKESGGLTIAQAEFDHSAMSGMPQSAAATGLVDYVLPVEDIPAKLMEYRDHLRKVASRKDGDGVRNDAKAHLATITALLRIKTDHDFSNYKQATLARRIQRRMQVLQIDAVPAYLERLRAEEGESDLLFRELLIGVTQFFRDPDAFAALQETVAEHIVERKSADETIRVWVPACSTGEEAYSITIILKEAMEQQGRTSKIQVFGTDLDDNAVAFARAARYRKMAGLSPERLRRWFIDDGEEIRPIRQVREVCIFSAHSVIKDPPFSRVDLISCRNLLIYLNHDVQDQLLRTFQYALNPGGVLFLGPSEGINRQGGQYAALNKKHHIFQRTDVPAAFPGLHAARAGQGNSKVGASAALLIEDPIEKSARRALEKYSPVYLVVDRDHNIVRFSGGEAGRYLEPSAGAASLELFNNLRRALRPGVRSALQKARSRQEAVNQEVQFQADGKTHPLTIIVEPISERGTEGVLFLVAFLERGAPSGESVNQNATISAIEEADIQALNRELILTKTQLQATIEDLETANEEMRSVVEEYQSVNEELQSTNEELQTSKEEMQSINEELQTVNAEMFAKNEALTLLNSDFKNLLDSTQIATIFLDDELCIKSFTPGITEIFRLREGDRGRPIGDIVTLIDYPELQRDFQKVLRELTTIERELQLKGTGQTFIMRIRPYRTIENVINGVVITFVDISARKKADIALESSEQRYAAIVNQATVGVAEAALDGRFQHANAKYREIVGRSEDQLRILRLDDLTYREDLQRMRALFSRLSDDGSAFQTETRYVRPDGSLVWVHNSVSPLVDANRRPHRVLIVALEIGERKHAEERASLLLAELDHRVKNILSIVSSVITQTLKASATPGEFAAAMEGRIAAIARAHSLLTDRGQGVASVRDLVLMELAPYDRVIKNIQVSGPPVSLTPRAGLAFAMAVHELTSNAAKYGALSTTRGRLAVTWLLNDNANGLLQFTWTESDGPPISASPSRRGFGTTLIERTLSHELDATVKREFHASGLHCTIDIPLSPEVFYASTSIN